MISTVRGFLCSNSWFECEALRFKKIGFKDSQEKEIVKFVHGVLFVHDPVVKSGSLALQAHDSSVRAMVWSHNDHWMLTADHGGFVKYWQSNMNNVKMYQAHKDPIRGLRCVTDGKVHPHLSQFIASEYSPVSIVCTWWPLWPKSSFCFGKLNTSIFWSLPVTEDFLKECLSKIPATSEIILTKQNMMYDFGDRVGILLVLMHFIVACFVSCKFCGQNDDLLNFCTISSRKQEIKIVLSSFDHMNST